MENTTKPAAVILTKEKVLGAVALIIITFLISRVPVAGDMFPAAPAVIACMVSDNPRRVYLILPAAAGILPYCFRGYDPWGSIIAMTICGIFFVAARHISFSQWHRAVIAAAASIISTSVYRIATLTIYKTDTQSLIFEGFLVFAAMYLIDGAYSSIKGTREGRSGEIPLAALAAGCLLTVCGAGLSFLVWPAAVFVSLWAAAYLKNDRAIFTAVAAGVTAGLLEQPQWGFLMTIVIGLCTASLCKKHTMLLEGVVFMLTCQALGSVESGVVLGIDSYYLLLGTAVFLAVNLKFGKTLKKAIMVFAGGESSQKENSEQTFYKMAEERSSEMGDLAELYSTYLDKRSILAGQFEISRQIIEGMKRFASTPRRAAADKFDADIAAAQCAAAGGINGDCCGWSDIGDSRIAMVLSDGMGKGKKAAAESLIVVKTITSLLRAGVSTEHTLKMINTVMLMKDDGDSFATVDLIIADKKTGHARFYKIGAAPTLIRRKDRVEEVKLSAVPLGIVNGLKIRYVETTLKHNDWIIMMSDGISDAGEGRDGRGMLEQLRRTVADVRSVNPQAMCDLIMDQASDSYIGRERDDLTVMVARII
ncbi:MAG: SpoIIE family protein phosphatase [Bacillota bacterium]|nr:SpoIIE family protein phosphatase [Bacillota bacterium]